MRDFRTGALGKFHPDRAENYGTVVDRLGCPLEEALLLGTIDRPDIVDLSSPRQSASWHI
ncbi:MAG: hypothetical protein ABSF89_16130 [Acidimicrobiales bacterium]